MLKGMDCVNKLFSLSSFSIQLHADGVRPLQATFLLCLLAPCQVWPALELVFLAGGGSCSLRLGCFFISSSSSFLWQKDAWFAVCPLLEE